MIVYIKFTKEDFSDIFDDLIDLVDSEPSKSVLADTPTFNVVGFVENIVQANEDFIEYSFELFDDIEQLNNIENYSIIPTYSMAKDGFILHDFLLSDLYDYNNLSLE